MSLKDGRGRSVAGVLAVAVLTAATWWLWLSWNTGYRFDPVTGERSGPYSAWQVIVCVLCLAETSRKDLGAPEQR